MSTFDSFRIDRRCLQVLRDQGIINPTPIQEKAIPLALEGRDVVALAQTGTGKTLAYSLPSLTRLAAAGRGRNRMLILTPTRELAVQVNKALQLVGRNLGLRSLAVYGGAGMEPQTRALRQGVDYIVACPGRLLDHMDRGNIRFDDLGILILDEADRMLDMGFLPDIKRILGRMPGKRQTMMFSATFPRGIEHLAADFLHHPARVEAGRVSMPAEAVKQGVFTVNRDGKMGLLSTLLAKPDVQSALVFLRTKHRTDRVARALGKAGFQAQAIHGGRTQNQRQQALDGFRNGRYRILVATDVAARGLDIRGVTHVVNYDIPTTSDDYIHRIGRTARASATGEAITFVCPDDSQALDTIERTLGRPLPRTDWEGAVHIPTVTHPAPRTKPGARWYKSPARSKYGRRRGKPVRPSR